MRFELVLTMLFSVAAAVAIAARRLKLPYTVALVVAGLLLGLGKDFPAPHLTKELLFPFFLPGLLFEAAFHLDWRDFLRNARTILSLAVPGLIAAIALTAAILAPVAESFAPGFGYRGALVFGAVIAATDPVSVVALFRSLNAPERPRVLVEGESLFNDGTGVVVFNLIVGAVTGAALTPHPP